MTLNHWKYLLDILQNAFHSQDQEDYTGIVFNLRLDIFDSSFKINRQNKMGTLFERYSFGHIFIYQCRTDDYSYYGSIDASDQRTESFKNHLRFFD